MEAADFIEKGKRRANRYQLDVLEKTSPNEHDFLFPHR